MPSAATLQVSVKFDNGPKIESSGKIEPGNYLFFEEELCRLSEPVPIPVEAGCLSKIAMIVISADKYAPEKDDCPKGTASDKRVKYCFADEATFDKKNMQCLNGPMVIRYPQARQLQMCDGKTSLEKIHVQNCMPIDTKVSILIVRFDPKCQKDKCSPAESAKQ